ncbi:MAG TPA: C40 family peptidase [Steroidobacteraceae bacterium]|nr:C40 family peptidase [Steroidobacteraceae bacterium]
MAGAHPARAAGALLIATLVLAGCASHARRPSPQADTGAAIAALAVSLVGAPYHFGGADAAGFDCSGLALYVHERFGLAIPRTASEQQRAARAVPLGAIAPGDLVFFRIHARGVDHVGIYAGAGRFIHAPRAGVAVAYGELSDGYYRARLVGAGRFWDGSSAGAAPR